LFQLAQYYQKRHNYKVQSQNYFGANNTTSAKINSVEMMGDKC
jgi:hypothetical protein